MVFAPGKKGEKMRQSEIEYLLLEAKKCQGMVKNIDSDFEFESYAKITPNFRNSSAAENEYRRIIDSAENKNSGYNGQCDYETLCGLISGFKAEYHSKASLEFKVDSTAIMESLDDMKAIADYYARKNNSLPAKDASEYIKGVIQEGKKYRRLFSRKVYSGKLGIEAVAADLFRGNIDKDYAIKNFECKNENSNLISFNNSEEEKPKKRKNPEKKESDPYQKVYDIFSDFEKWNYAQSKKDFGNIFEKIFYSIIYPGF